MLKDAFALVLSQLSGVFTAIVSLIAIVLSIALALIAYKKYREAMFISSPQATDGFVQWHKDHHGQFDNIHDSARAYIHAKNAAAKFDMIHGKSERKRQAFYEGRNAYRYFKAQDNYLKNYEHKYHNSIDKLGYRGFDDSDYDGVFG